MKPKVTFFTNCWEGDWRYLLKTNRLKNMIENNDFPFTQKILCISNVEDLPKVEKYAKKFVEKGILTSYFVADQYVSETLNFFDLTKEELKQSYKYTLAPLTCLYLCQTEYLVHHTGDVILPKKRDWISPSIIELNKSEQFVVANPTWDGKYESARSESFAENDNYFIGFGFSDQCYLIKKDTFCRPIYKEWNEASARYPEYGMWGFERRVDSWMRNHNLTRLTCKFADYRHDTFPKNKWKQRIELLTGKRTRK
jgi:hypothetical protein